MRLNFLGKTLLLLLGSAAAAGAVAQSQTDTPNPLDLPANPQFLGDTDPNVRKATAIVNGDVITGTDVDQRVALILLANGGTPTAEQMQLLKQQVLRNLVDETLQIQAATSKDIKVEPKEIDRYFAEYAKNMKQSPQQFGEFLRAHGSSSNSIKRQIQGELAWRRLQGRQIEPFVNVADEEVKAVIDRLNASKGAQEYRVGEIFLSSAPENASQTQANLQKILDQLKGGGNFQAYARQFSEASTAAVGGDLGWVKADQLPDPLSQALKGMQVGQVAGPIPVPGGFSILALQDTRQVLTADPRDAVLSLKQLSVTFPANTPKDAAEAKIKQLTEVAANMGGCGGAEAAAQKMGGEVVTSDQMQVRDLPGPLQDMLLKMGIGEATKPFGSLEDGVRVLVLCGRDDPQTGSEPNYDQIYAQLEEERVNMRARRYLRDLRRDAVVEYR